jgi:hypothetical protein
MVADLTALVGSAVTHGAAHVGAATGSARGARASELPPHTNRGVTVTWQGVHWFAGTCRTLAPSAVLDVLKDFLQVPMLARPRGGYGYTHSAGGAGASVYWSLGRGDVFVVLPGEVCEALGIPALVALAITLDMEPSSRLDVAWDIEGLPVEVVAAAWHAGNVVTRSHRDSWQDHNNSQGRTFYMGSRSSGRMVRCYDRRGPTRLEMEWKSDRAVLLWRRLVAVVEESWSLTAMSELRAFLDFRQREPGVNPTRCELLDWWAEVTAGAARSCTCIPRQAKTLEDKRQWLRSQVAPVLAMVADGVEDWIGELADLIAGGRDRYTRRVDRLALVDQARQKWGSAAD